MICYFTCVVNCICLTWCFLEDKSEENIEVDFMTVREKRLNN